MELNRWSTAECSHKQRDDEQDEENIKQRPCDVGSGAGDAGKTKGASNHGDDEK